MAVGGGPVKSYTVDGVYYASASDAVVNRFLGGTKSTIEMNGDGTARPIGEILPWSLTGCQLAIDDLLGSQEALQAISNAKVPVPITVTFEDGLQYGADGLPVGDNTKDSAKGTFATDFSGGGPLTLL